MLGSKALLLIFTGVAVAGRFHKRQDRAGQGQFNLFAYNEDIGGLPVASNGVDVFIANINNSSATAVLFSEGEDGLWYASPNRTTTDDQPVWGNLSLTIPGPSSPPGAVQLEDPRKISPRRSNTGFTFYGTVAFHTAADGSFESFWLARPDGDGLWSLQWNETGYVDSGLPVTLKSTPPSWEPFH